MSLAFIISLVIQVLLIIHCIRTGRNTLWIWAIALLPLARRSLVTAAVLTFAHTVGEFGVVLMIGGDIPGITRTLSISIFDQVQELNYAAANRTSLVLIGVSLVALLLLYGRRTGVGNLDG